MSKPFAIDPDVLVIGGGAAGLSAAISARESGASVLVVDAAPPWMRGGDARHARNLRLAHDTPNVHSPDAYSAEEFLAELRGVAGDDADAALAQRLTRDSAGVRDWLLSHGVRLQPHGAPLPYSRRTVFMTGGGNMAIRSLYAAARALGVEIVESAEVCRLDLGAGGVAAVDVAHAGPVTRVTPRAIIVCAGGRQGDRDWLRRDFGAAADRIVVRGSPYANGAILRRLIELGARTVGDPARGHFVAVDARGPAVDGGIVTRLQCIPFGVVVDGAAARFADEGADRRRTHFARWGETLMHMQGDAAFLILDADGFARAPPAALAPVRAATIDALALALGLDAAALGATIARYNAAVRAGAADRPQDWRTEGLTPGKSSQAAPIARAPFAAYPLRPGVTFTHFGVAVDETLRVKMRDGTALANCFAAGMVMAANVLPRGYLSGLALTLCLVFGRQAGADAARFARALQSQAAPTVCSRPRNERIRPITSSN